MCLCPGPARPLQGQGQLTLRVAGVNTQVIR